MLEGIEASDEPLQQIVDLSDDPEPSLAVPLGSDDFFALDWLTIVQPAALQVPVERV